MVEIMRLKLEHGRLSRRVRRPAGPVSGESGFTCTLWEVLIAVIIVALVCGTIFNGYVLGAKRGQWTGYSLAAQSLAVQSLEQARSAVWDIAMGNTEVTNMTLFNKVLTVSGSDWTMTGYTTNILDIPWKGTNYVLATNFVSISTFFENGTTNPWVQMQSIRVDTVWPFDGWGNFSTQCYTNTVCTYMAPDNRDPSTLGGNN